MRLIITLLFMLGFSATSMAAGDSYYIGSRDGTDVYAYPNKSASVTAHLPWKTDIRLQEKIRNWQKIETTGANRVKGWVFESAVRKRYQPASKKSDSSLFSRLTSLFRSPEPEQKTAVLGVRGLEDEGVANTDNAATQHANQMVKWMDRLNVPDREVAAFIEEGELNP